MSDLLKTDADTVTLVNDVINSFMSKNAARAAAISPYYEQLWREVERLIQSGGKRVRPRLTITAYQAFGGTNIDQVIPVAASQELLHLSLLVHDDIIDRDFVRYGVDNVTGRYDNSHYLLVENENDRLHYAQSAAILAGDLLLSGSYQIMLESSIETELLAAIQHIHGRSIFEVAGGELLDTESAFRLPGMINAKAVAVYKTASYTFIGPLLIGATLAGASDDEKVLLAEYARNLGIAYQLRDDVIGVFGDEETIGKTTTGDIREGKYTFMVEQFYVNASADEKTAFDKHFGDKDVTREGVEIVKKLLVSSGALQKTEEAITEYADEAARALKALSFDEKSDLAVMIDTVTKRDK